MPARNDSSEHTGGDAVVDALEAIGVRVVFGIPSVHNLPTYDALARRGTIRMVTVRHEQAAAAAADGYARVSGELGTFITSTGPGAANAMGGLLEAYVSGSPVLHLTGQIETRYLGAGRGFIHEVPDQPAMLGALSKAVLRAESPEDIAATVLEGARSALTAPRGPVSIELPIDLQYAEAAFSALTFEAPVPVAEPLSPDDLARAVELLSAAKRPVIWVGGGAVSAGAEEEVRALAEHLGAGVLTTPNARGILGEDHPLSIGNLPWDKQVRALVGDSDLLIGIGTRYQGPNTENWKMELPGSLLQIDVDPAVPGRNYQASLVLRGDARQVLVQVLSALGTTVPDESWTARVGEVASAARAALRSSLGAHEALLDETAAVLDGETVVVKDSTIPAYTWGNRLLPVQQSRRAVMPNGFAIGLGLPHAMGAAVAAGRPVLLMAGDGGFMLTATELATIAEENLPVVAVVFNDGGYGILRNIQERQYQRRAGVDLGRPDFVALAASLGVAGERVGAPGSYGKALRRGLEGDGPYLVEVDLESIGPMGRPYTGTSRPPQGSEERPAPPSG